MKFWDSLTFILHHWKISLILVFFITLLLKSILWRGKHQKTGHAIKRKRRKIQVPKSFFSLVVVYHSEVANSNFNSCRFCDHLGKMALYQNSPAFELAVKRCAWSYLTEISLLGNAFSFSCNSRCLCLIWVLL